jgi:hypothetical protein
LFPPICQPSTPPPSPESRPPSIPVAPSPCVSQKTSSLLWPLALAAERVNGPPGSSCNRVGPGQPLTIPSLCSRHNPFTFGHISPCSDIFCGACSASTSSQATGPRLLNTALGSICRLTMGKDTNAMLRRLNSSQASRASTC